MAIIKRAEKTRKATAKKPIKREKPSDPTPDPLKNVEYTDDLEEDARREIEALREGYRERAANEQNRRIAATDSEHWFAVSFRSREEKNRFLAAIGFVGRAAPDKYMTGDQLAAVLGIDY
ncbi:MAG: hypothetical protein E6845_18850 [Clostridium sp.]|uniref:hypothetical protein n=1 Tax=Clostridium sp. TaxID=1506 RepID=UPI002900A24E|nr:hypothetical protein [Clostridium sp.]MDU1605017.1 hypothetical protein [Clostridium sp.]